MHSPFRLALLPRVHPPLAISRQQNHALWLNTGFFKSLTILIPIFLGVFFHAALSVSSSTGKKVPRAPACCSPVLMSILTYLQSLSSGTPSPSTLKIGFSLTLSVITCSNILSPIQCQARKSSSMTQTTSIPMALLFATPEGIRGLGKLDCARSCPCFPCQTPAFGGASAWPEGPISRAARALCRRTCSLPSQVFLQPQGNEGPLQPPLNCCQLPSS